MNAMDDIRIRAGSEVTEAEATAVIAWCRDWYADCARSIIDPVSEEELSHVAVATEHVPALLRESDRLIEGGLAFVLADVRRCATEDAESDGIESAGAFTGTPHTLDVADKMTTKPSAMNLGLRATYWNEDRATWVSVYDGTEAGNDTSGGRWQVICERHGSIVSVDTLALAHADARGDTAEFCEDCQAIIDQRAKDHDAAGLARHHADSINPGSSRGWQPAERIATGTVRDVLADPASTEDGAVSHPASAEDIAEAMASEPRVTHSVIDEDGQFFVVSSDGQRDPFAWSRREDAEATANDYNTFPGRPDAKTSSASGEPYVVDYLRAREIADDPIDAAHPNEVAARIAREASETFAFDQDSEDAESAAQRVSDILRDMVADVPHGFDERYRSRHHGAIAPMRPEVAAFLTRVFGLPVEERYVSRDVQFHRSRYEAGNALPEDWPHRLRAATLERGLPDVARVLVFEYRDVVLRVVFAGHEATETLGESTNLHAFREACAAWDKLNELRSHAYGDMSLDGCQDIIETMSAQAIEAMIGACQYAICNASNGDSEDSLEVGMPRAE